MPGVAGSIIVVTFNSAGHIEACLRSLPDSDWDRIVVDNASQDGTLDRARSVAGTRILANSQNRGFAAAANQAARAAPGQFLLFLNPDAVAEPGALTALRAAAEPEKVAAVGGFLVNPDGSPQAGFVVRRFPTLGSALAEVLLLNRLFPGNPWNRRYRCLNMNLTQPAAVEQPAGACLLVKRAAWEAVGGFDEQFHPLWFEDVDFCHRLRDAGWTIRYEPRARFRHAGAHSLAGLELGERQLYWYRNLLRYFRKHHGTAAVGVLRLGILVGMMLRLVASLFGVQVANERGAAIRAYWRVIRQCVFGRVSE